MTYNFLLKGRVLPYWIGGHKINGEFKWMPNKEKIEKFRWHQYEPTNSEGHEDCLQTWENEFDWNDNSCGMKYRFICELKL